MTLSSQKMELSMTKRSLPTLLGRRPRGLDFGDTYWAQQREVDRVFDDFGRLDYSRAGRGPLTPRLDVSETDGQYVIEAELPGVDIKDVDVSLDGDILTIRGEKKTDREDKSKDYHLIERSYGSFERSIALGFTTDAKKISATFDKGVLRVTAPKPAEAKTEKKKIEIASA
jgi:HSP20 family protein